MVQYSVRREHAGCILDQLNRWRCDGTMSDVKLLAHGKHISAHRCILAAFSPYFQSMFSGSFVESTNNTVDLSAVTNNSDALESIISCFYQGTIDIHKDNVSDLLHLASFLLADDLKTCCDRFLQTFTNLENCLPHFTLAHFYNLPELLEITLSFIKHRFHDYFIHQDALLQMSSKQMELVMSRDATRHCQPDTICKFLLQWYLHEDSDMEEKSRVVLRTLQSLCSDRPEKDTADKMLVVFTDYDAKLKDSDKEFAERLKTLFDEHCSDADENERSTSSEENLLDALIVLAPTRYLVNESFQVNKDSDPDNSDSEGSEQQVPSKPIGKMLDLSMYIPDHRTWYKLGSLSSSELMPPDLLASQYPAKNWSMACIHNSLYFFCTSSEQAYCLCLKSMVWTQLDCPFLRDPTPERTVELIAPIVAGEESKLYVLVRVERKQLFSELVDVQLQCYLLTDDSSWVLATEMPKPNLPRDVRRDFVITCGNESHISILQLMRWGKGLYGDLYHSNPRISCVVDLTVHPHTMRSLPDITGEYIFDELYIYSPVNMFESNNKLYVLDGGARVAQHYNFEEDRWIGCPIGVEVSEKPAKAGWYPCSNYLSTGDQNGLWQLIGYERNETVLEHMYVGEGVAPIVEAHVPPPYLYFTMSTIGKIDENFVRKLDKSRFIHY